MKLQQLQEAKYDQPTTRKLTGKLSLESGLYLRTNFSIHVSLTGSSVTLPMRQEKDEACELIKVDGNGVEVPHIFTRKQHCVLHTYKTGWLLKSSRWQLEPEKKSNVHYDEVHEAQYAFSNYVNWVQDNVDAKKSEASLKFDSKGIGVALKQLTRRYGQPRRYGQQTREYWLWQNDSEDGSYDITLWSQTGEQGELLVHVYSEMDID